MSYKYVSALSVPLASGRAINLFEWFFYYQYLGSRGMKVFVLHATELEGPKTRAVDDEVSWSATAVRRG